MGETTYKINQGCLQLHGNGLFSKEEVTVSISKAKQHSGIVFVLNNEKIPAVVTNVSNSNRNTVLSGKSEIICLVEHFLAACSLLGVDDIEVVTNKNELVFNDGSSIHWYEAISGSELKSPVNKKYNLRESIFVKDENGKREIIAIPSDDFKISYFMDIDHPVLGKLWADWQLKDGIEKLLRARTFATKEENDFFDVSDRLLTLDKNGFNKKLHEPLEPLYHKMLDIVGDLRLSGVNPLEVNMHVIGFKSGHMLNVELARQLRSNIF